MACMDPVERRRVLTRFANLLTERSDDLHAVPALESGIPISYAGVLVHNSLNWKDYAASAADKLSGEVVPTEPGAAFDYTLVEPVGVVGVIIPWNGPVGSLGMCAAPPLAAGCCVIIKPSELAPFSATLFARLALEAGIPPGVVSVVQGASDTGALGWLLVTNGQACTLASRFIVHRDIYDEYTERLAGLMNDLKVGDAMDRSTGMGPVITEAAADRIMGMVDRAKGDGATLLAGGVRLEMPGFMIAPTLFGDVDNSSELGQEEVFGPVLSVLRFDHEDEAIALANSSRYGLAGYIHTNDLNRAFRVASAMETGNIWVNGGVAPAAANAPFGGYKQSGLGRVGGISGILEYTRTKNVQIRF